MPSRPGKVRAVLDVGCGDGLFFDRLVEFGVVDGVETDASLVDPQGPHAARIHIGPFDADFRPERRYDLILMLDVVEHMPDAEAGLRRAEELLTDDGLLVATVPAFNALWTAHDDFNHHYTRYTKRSFAAVARQAGLQVDARRYFFHWTVPIKLAVRGVEALRRRSSRPAAVPPAWINGPLYALSRWEQSTLGRLPLPMGSSLLVVGRREKKHCEQSKPESQTATAAAGAGP
ncbi:MAG: class I SAM-dependent methyltransferase [Planctomycetia bacterium]|nr:class I SAM-dependent methyltransferase [Planctomycetia bacterium]